MRRDPAGHWRVQFSFAVVSYYRWFSDKSNQRENPPNRTDQTPEKHHTRNSRFRDLMFGERHANIPGDA